MTKVFKRKNGLNNVNSIAPDGGWGWLVCIAGGLSLMFTFNIRKNFGLIFREYFQKLGITNSEITSIINFHIAIASFQGFLYGPIYRYLSIRQVALSSAILIIFGIFLLAFVKTFASFVISFSIIYGLGTGFHKSATFLCLNTYFLNLRRQAYSLTLTLSAIGPVIMPLIINTLLYYYNVQDTVIIFSGIAMHSIAFALIYQPVKWHSKKLPKKIYVINVVNDRTESNSSVRSFDTLDSIIVEDSVNSIQKTQSKFIDHNLNLKRHCPSDDQGIINHKKNLDLNICYSNYINGKYNQISDPECYICKINLKENDLEINDNEKNSQKFNGIEYNPQISDLEFEANQINCRDIKKNNSIRNNVKIENDKNSNCFKKLSSLFDLDLLRDLSYLNIVFGFAFSTVAELNCTLLTPFFLADFNLTNNQIALVMSTVAFTDIISRFLLPYITIKIKWNSRIFYMIGISGTTLCRIAIAQNPSYHVHLILFSFMGAFTATRSVFMNLVLPEYLPLEKLPSAIGLQQIPSGLFALILGPVVGLIRDATNYSFVLYILSSFSILTIILWTIEMVWIKMKMKIFKLK